MSGQRRRLCGCGGCGGGSVGVTRHRYPRPCVWNCAVLLSFHRVIVIVKSLLLIAHTAHTAHTILTLSPPPNSLIARPHPTRVCRPGRTTPRSSSPRSLPKLSSSAATATSCGCYTSSPSTKTRCSAAGYAATPRGQYVVFRAVKIITIPSRPRPQLLLLLLSRGGGGGVRPYSPFLRCPFAWLTRPTLDLRWHQWRMGWSLPLLPCM